MTLKQLLFPEQSRSFPGKRWANVGIRSLHLLGVAMFSGGLYFDINQTALLPWYMMTAVSGVALTALDTYGNGKWLIQNRGASVLFKIAVLGILTHTHMLNKWVIILLIILSGVTSHAPARFRYYSLYHGKEI